MTLITDDKGTRWVEVPVRKRRKSSRALRFADLKVGDQLMRRWTTYEKRVVVCYYVVTDLWFDPVAGQDDEISGRMVAIRHIDPRNGELHHRKEAHTLRGLAFQGFHYADIDFAAHVRALVAAKERGDAVDIRFGHVLRKRPKIAGKPL